jgi:pimeloyl-ACP methyl ester carboxylesterase
MEPRSHRWEGNDLVHHVLEWRARDTEDGPTALLVHGFQDAAATFDDVAADLARAGLRVLVPDMRGFGDGARVPKGGYYYFPDYVADLAAIAHERLARGTPLFVVGHSMGATVVTYLAGAYPELVTKLALIDGVGPMDNAPDVAPTRMRRWIETVDKARTWLGDAMPFASVDEAVSRFAKNNPDVDEAVLARRVPALLRQLEGGRGWQWKFDRLHLSVSPVPFFAESYKAFARRVTGPVLHVSGGTKGHHVPDEEERLACFARLTRVTIEGGHMLHWTRPRELAAALASFWNAA